MGSLLCARYHLSHRGKRGANRLFKETPSFTDRSHFIFTIRNLRWILCAVQQSCCIFIHSSTLLDTFPSLSCPKPLLPPRTSYLVVVFASHFPEKMEAVRKISTDSQHIYPSSVSEHSDTPHLIPDGLPVLPSEASPFHYLILFPSHPLRVIFPSLSRPFSSLMNHSHRYSNCSYSSHFKTFS